MTDLDLRYLVGILPDTLRRTPIRLDWLTLTISDIQKQYTTYRLGSFYDANYDTLHNSQTLSLEAVLNDKVRPAVPITITDGNWIRQIYLSLIDEHYIDNLYVFTEAEGVDSAYLFTTDEILNQIDFFVNVDSHDANEYNINIIDNVIKQYKYADKNYYINEIE